MDRREEIIRLWFQMWLEKEDRGMETVFDKDAVYVESWGPEYRGQPISAHHVLFMSPVLQVPGVPE